MKRNYRGYVVAINHGRHGWYYFITKENVDSVLYISEAMDSKNKAWTAATNRINSLIEELRKWGEKPNN